MKLFYMAEDGHKALTDLIYYYTPGEYSHDLAGLFLDPENAQKWWNDAKAERVGMSKCVDSSKQDGCAYVVDKLFRVIEFGASLLKGNWENSMAAGADGGGMCGCVQGFEHELVEHEFLDQLIQGERQKNFLAQFRMFLKKMVRCFLFMMKTFVIGSRRFFRRRLSSSSRRRDELSPGDVLGVTGDFRKREVCTVPISLLRRSLCIR